jgi:hypothetical protein
MSQDTNQDHPPDVISDGSEENLQLPGFFPSDLKLLLDVSIHQEVIRSKPVTFEECEALALVGVQVHREFAMSSFHSSLHGDTSYFELGYEGSGNFRSFEHTGISFANWPRINTHNHHEFQENSDQDGIPVHVLPSGGSYKNQIGDFLSHVSVIDDGGNLNVATPLGMCVYIGLDNPKGIASDEPLGWLVESGTNKGAHFSENSVQVDGGLGRGPLIELAHKDNFGIKRRFVFATWDIIRSSTRSGVTYNGLCFRKDLPIFIEMLGVRTTSITPQPDNLHSLYALESQLLKKLM